MKRRVRDKDGSILIFDNEQEYQHYKNKKVGCGSIILFIIFAILCTNECGGDKNTDTSKKKNKTESVEKIKDSEKENKESSAKFEQSNNEDVVVKDEAESNEEEVTPESKNELPEEKVEESIQTETSSPETPSAQE